MKKRIFLLLLLTLSALTVQSVLAQSNNHALVPLPSLHDFTQGQDGWAVVLGLSVEYETAYEGSDEFGFEVQPAGASSGAAAIIFFTLLVMPLIGVGRRFGQQAGGTGSEINLVAVFHDSKYANTGFGINAQQAAASGLTATTLSGGLRSIGIDYNVRYYLAKKWHIFGEALFEYYSSEVRASPIARSNYETEVGIGVIYIF